MGVVFKAEDPQLRRLVALKAMLPSLAVSDTARQRFLREAQAAAAIQHDHIVPIYDIGEDNGVPYLAMPFLRGETLETRLRRLGGPLPTAEVLRIGLQIAEGLSAIHELGLIHRDVKPANIYVCRYGLELDFVKLLDFGLVKTTGLTDERGHQLTVAGIIAGTPGYMSPEIGSGSPDVDWRADIYALGCVAYWLVTGLPVFEGANPMQVVMAHIHKQPIPPSRRVTTKIPPALEEIILDCLKKDPNDRPQTMQELGESLRQIPLENPWTEERARQWWLVNGARVGKAPPEMRPAESSASGPASIAAGQN